MADMRIAVIGTGHIGGTLGERFRAAGHDVRYGSRGAPAEGPGGALVLPVADALADSDVVLLAIPGSAVGGVLAPHGEVLAGKVIIDATNNIGAPQVDSRPAVTQAAPGASYARAFNTLGWENFADPIPGACLFFAADDGARAVTEELITAVGLEPAYVGDADAVGTVDALLPLWFSMVKQHGGNRRIALRIVDS
jgi:8-hydroxy-5-deazaflavin:NADPH oxidoreductase